MNTPKPQLPGPLPASHPMRRRTDDWVRLRDELAQLAAHLEYLKLMLRLEQRKSS